jgi:mediator of RNA polymerase II transcription subunit 18
LRLFGPLFRFCHLPKHLGYLHFHFISRAMHELLLYGQVPLERHDQLLKVLAGIAAMQPQTLFERHLIYKPMRSAQDNKPNKKFPNKPVKPQTLTFQHLVRQLDQSEFGKRSGILSEPEKNPDAIQPAYTWRITTRETPEPETKIIVLRQATDVALDHDQLRNFLDPINNG